MTNEGESNFLALNQSESHKKLSLLSPQDPIGIKGKELSLELSFEDLKIDNDEVSLLLKPDDLLNLDHVLETEVSISCFVSGIRYFAKAFAIERSRLVLKTNLYRREKRTEERLLLFPHHTAHFYLKLAIESEDMENVVSLSRATSLKKEKLDEYVALEKNELTKGMIGFRALDVSFSGISFIANEYEAKILEEYAKFDAAILDINNYFYEIVEVSFRHTVNYLNASTAETPMFKVGFSFENQNTKLSNKIERFILSSNKLDSSYDEFEQSMTDVDDL